MIFHSLVEQIELYEKQFELTLEMYKTEWKRESSELKKEYTIEKEKRKIDFDRFYKEMKGHDEETRDGYASHHSGLDILDHENFEKNERLKKKYSDFFDTYSKSVLVVSVTIITPEDLLLDIKELLEEQQSNKEEPQAEKKWIKSHQAQRMLAISPGTLQNLRINGTLQYTKLGGVIFYDKSVIERILEQNMQNKPLVY
ncbi:MAG: hypothetical protein ACJA1C_000922 [Crocinitomicaceae bacterium]